MKNINAEFKNLSHALEFDKILSDIASYAIIEKNKSKILSFRPLNKLEDIKVRHTAVQDALNVLTKKTSLHFVETSKISNYILNAKKNKILSGNEIFQIIAFLEIQKKNIKILQQGKTLAPNLSKVAHDDALLDNLLKDIKDFLDQKGQIKPNATKTLEYLNLQLENLSNDIKNKLDVIMSKYADNNIIQEEIITLRNDRFCLSVKSSEKKSIPGIVHNTSDSGQTVFLEPLSTVDMGNDRQEIFIEIKKEIQRILEEMTTIISDAHSEIKTAIKSHNYLDEIFAIAKCANNSNSQSLITYSDKNPFIKKEMAHLKFINACHPLIKDAVPLNIEIDSTINAIAITGPNTGGKTVVLKTVGLLVSMALSGLPIPAQTGTIIPLYDYIYCDIGDEQSIQQSLSTFSAHIKSILTAINSATNKSLILIDELGAGTDPDEGARLATSILDHLIKTNAHLIVTTHHSEVKKYAYENNDIINASMEFDSNNLKPTYLLTLGLPGSSNALIIAEKLGLPKAIIKQATKKIPQNELNYTTLNRKLKARIIKLENMQIILKNLKIRLNKRVQDLNQNFNSIKNLSSEKNLHLLNEFKKQNELFSKNIAELEKKHSIEKNKKIYEEAQKVKEELEKIIFRKTNYSIDQYKIDEEVFVPKLKVIGKITKLQTNDRIEVTTASSSINLKIDEIDKIDQNDNKSKKFNSMQKNINFNSIDDPGMEVEIRGKPIDIAVAEAEQFLDRAVRFGHKRVKIIHGKGSGKLKKIIQEILEQHPLIERYENAAFGEGGAGVTIVYLEDIN